MEQKTLTLKERMYLRYRILEWRAIAALNRKFESDAQKHEPMIASFHGAIAQIYESAAERYEQDLALAAV